MSGSEMIWKTLFYLSLPFRPKYWIMNNPYSEVWDRELQRLMALCQFERKNRYQCTIGGVTVWTGNHPYASFTPENLDVRPSRWTIYQARQRLEQDVIASGNEGRLSRKALSKERQN